MLILGQGALARPDGYAVLKLAHAIAERCGLLKTDEGWNGFNVLHTAAARVGDSISVSSPDPAVATRPAFWPGRREVRSNSSTCLAPTK